MSNQLLIRRRELEAKAKWVTANGLSPMTIQAKKLKSIGVYGRCEQEQFVVWNELVKNGDFALWTDSLPNSWTTTTTATGRLALSKLTNDGGLLISFTGDNPTSSSIEIRESVIGIMTPNKYFIIATIRNSVSFSFGGNANNSARISVSANTTEREISGIVSPSSTSSVFSFQFLSGTTGFTNSDFVEVKNLTCINLTLMYGAGNEPTTVQDFKDSYEDIFGHPLTYEPYNPGTVLETKDIVCNNGALKWNSVNQEIYTDGTQEILKVRHNGITPSSFAGYVATSEKTGPYSYSFSWSPTSSNTWNGVSAGNITIIEGHKYYYCANMLSSTPANLYLSFSSGLTAASKGKTNVVANTDYLISAISEATASSNSIIMYVRAGYADAGGDYTGYANNIGLFDLTAIFGAGNEPTTTSEARQQLCLDSNFSTENLLSCGTYKDFQNLTTGEISHNVGVKVLTGTETFALDNWRSYSGTYAFALYRSELPNILLASTDNVKSTHFQSATYSGGGGLYYGGTGICIYSNNGNYSVFIRVPNSIATDMATMKTWLAQQYANGTPVIIVYPLNDTQSDSTSGQTLPTIRKGLNTIEVTQASVESTHDLSVQATYKEINDTHDYLSFTATEASSSITLNKIGSPTSVNLEWSPNKTAWIPYTIGETIPIANGNTVYLRKTANTVATQLSSSSSNYYKFLMTGSINGGGNIMSLLDKSCVSTIVGNYCFYYLFIDCTALKKSPKLPAMTLGTHCYYSMFYNAGLTTAPVLPATTMAANCYYGMFYNCKFTVAPQLPATELATSCYTYMFTNCTVMAVAPELPATVLKNNCYHQMFYQCFGLTSFPRLQFTTMATGCFTYMFQSCRNITSYHLSSLNTSGNTFYGNSGCNSLTIDAVVPPTIGSNTITGLKADCIIYVPAESVQAYKEKQYWSDRASYIQGLDENGNIPTS